MTGRATFSRRAFTALRPKAMDEEELPYVRVEEGFARWRDHKPVIHDCVVDVSASGTIHSFLISAYYDCDRYPLNPSISRCFTKLPSWHGEVAVIFLGKRKFYKKTAQLNHARKAAAAYVEFTQLSLSTAHRLYIDLCARRLTALR